MGWVGSLWCYGMLWINRQRMNEYKIANDSLFSVPCLPLGSLSVYTQKYTNIRVCVCVCVCVCVYAEVRVLSLYLTPPYACIHIQTPGALEA